MTLLFQPQGYSSCLLTAGAMALIRFKQIDEAHEKNKQILIAAGVKPETIFRTTYESGRTACTATIGEIIGSNQESQIKQLYVSDASAFPTPLGMPSILTSLCYRKGLPII